MKYLTEGRGLQSAERKRDKQMANGDKSGEQREIEREIERDREREKKKE